MLRYTVLIGLATFSVPVEARIVAGAPQTSSQSGAIPQASQPDASTQQGAPTDAVPMQPAAREQPATSSQVAQVIDAEFPNYDKNADGKLNPAEFGAWMVALKSKTDPTTKATAPDTRKWVDAAFAQADADKNKSLSKAELTSFLSQG
ncbi:EF-hand domain-containing protein [Sphingomonas sp. R86520]|uniref:EF-hand domain-containing protein n=1 Tax=Sphingomonas sp. R86520 TaxID=3093859 RepID=UPI0036D23468